MRKNYTGKGEVIFALVSKYLKLTFIVCFALVLKSPNNTKNFG